MNRACMFPLLLSMLFSIAALSPFLEKSWTPALPELTTVCTEWNDLSVYLPESLIAAPLSNEAPDEQTFISTDGQVEVIVRRSTRPPAQDIHTAYNARVEDRWAHTEAPIDLLDKMVDENQYRLEWLVDRSVLIEKAFVLDDEWITVEAGGPLAQRAFLQELITNWKVEKILALP